MAHFGGHITKTGSLASGPAPKTRFKSAVRVEKLVRFDLAKAQGNSLLTDAEIARVLGCTIRTIAQLRSRIPYLRKRMELTTGISLDAETEVNTTITRHKQMLRELMPDAMRAVADAIQFKAITLAEKKFKFDVAKEILDREGTFPKISRTDVHSKIEHSFESLDGVSQDILDSIEGSVQHQDTPQTILETLAANAKFSNSETLAMHEQEAALAALESIPVDLNKLN